MRDCTRKRRARRPDRQGSSTLRERPFFRYFGEYPSRRVGDTPILQRGASRWSDDASLIESIGLIWSALAIVGTGKMEDKTKYFQNKNSTILIGSKKYRLNALKYKSNEDKIELMRTWFFDNYADPIDLPYNGREGGYQYIYGGPYDAGEELFGTFSEYIEDRFIEALIDDLNSENYEWGKNPDKSDWYYEQFVDLMENQYEEIYSSISPLESFNESIGHIKEMLEIKVTQKKERYMLGMLQVNIITAMETYLAEAFISSLERDSRFMFNFLSKSEEYKIKNIPMSRLFSSSGDIEKQLEDIKAEVKASLVDKLWHKLKSTAVPLYKITYNIEFPREIGVLYKAVAQRHDWVHRNGKDKKGELLEISKTTITELITKVEELVQHIDDRLKVLICDVDHDF